uniref:Uncharacterized protein n=1 Tax=Cebus imitator TaxID=2715852 RepID=A0A2K5PQD5_CEBIM
MPQRPIAGPGLDLGLHCILSSGLSWSGGRRGVGVNPSLFKFQLGLLEESSWLVLDPNLAALFIGSQMKRCRQ